ncbi:hypothetical protein EIP86_003867 [Pleurotus ostreatoroseus]|nr:hypothetical protein EIP86_003867 [Pleurotus ostreatoroseus]
MSVAEAQTYPHASGIAAKTAEEHQEPQELVFYAAWFCPFATRAWIALEEKGVPYQYKEVNPYKKEKHFLDINPLGLVPAFEYQGKALYESVILDEFLEDVYPSYGTNLLPEDPYERARARIWIDYVSKKIVPAYFRLIQAQGADKQRAALEDLNQALGTFAAQIKGPYFLGDAFSLVDVVVAPWIARDYIPAEHRGYRREAVENGWKSYAEAVEKRDSVIRTQSDKERYHEVYGRYLRDEAQSEVAKATRTGGVIP